MPTTTFKIFKPNGDCRRVTFDTVPELSALNEIVDGLVDQETRDLIYMDSEGDRIVIKSSRDVAEAVRDADATNAKTVKIWIRFHQKHGTAGPCGRGAARTNNKNRRRCGGGLFAHPGWVGHCGFSSDFNNDVNEILGALFPGFFIHSPHHGRNKESGNAESASSDGEAKEDSSNTTNDSKEDVTAAASTSQNYTHQSEDEKTPFVTPPVEAEQQDAKVEVKEVVKDTMPKSDIPSKASKGEDELKSKVTMLREMGFELPDEVARNMINELGGRMDLIVRALVANNK